MEFDWLKGHGTENDFVLLPDHDGRLHGALDPALVARICHRRRGVGADGVLRVIRAAALRDLDPAIPATDAEWFMDYRNSDGSLSEMCGNGVRVFALHLAQEGLVDPDGPIRIGTRAGTKVVTADGDRFTADMGPAEVLGETKVAVGDRVWPAVRISMGNPHAVAFVDDLADAGRLLEPPAYDVQHFPAGVNVEFVRRMADDHIAMRVHERGSGETRSCGTGACAAAVAAALDAGSTRPAQVVVDVPGGCLSVRWRPDGVVELTGPAEIVARGRWLAPKLG